MSHSARLLVAALGLVWGTNFLTTTWAAESISPGQIGVLRVLLGLLPVTAFALARRELSWSHLRHAHHLFVLSLLATTIHVAAFAAGTPRLPSGLAGALSGAIPLFAVVAAFAFLRSERLGLRRVAGVLAGLAGVLVIARPWEGSGSPVDPLGAGLLLAGSASVALSLVYARRFITDLPMSATALTTYQLALGLVTLGAFADFEGIGAITETPRGMGAILTLGLFGTGIATILHFAIVGRFGAVTAANVTYLPPVVALALGWLVAGETLGALDGLAALLVLAGVIVSSAERPGRPADGPRLRRLRVLRPRRPALAGQ